MMHVSIFKSHADINTSHVDINILHVYILMLHPAFGLLSETSSRSEFSILQNFSCMLTQFILQMGGRNMPVKFLSILVYFEPPPPILFYKCCHCIIYMDLNLRLYLFSDRELNYFIIFDIYNMHLSLFFLDHCYFKDVMHAWQGNTKEQRFFSILHKRFYKSLDFIWQDYCPL